MTTTKTGELTLNAWLEALGSKESTPGGGGAAAVIAAHGAALIGMVARNTPRPSEDVTELMRTAESFADGETTVALILADADAHAFGAVMDAYKMPRETDEQKAARTTAIQDAAYGAAQPPLSVADLAAGIIAMAKKIEPDANKNLLSDVAVACIAAQAALHMSYINVEVNLTAVKDETRREELVQSIGKHLQAMGEAQAVISLIRERIKG